MNDIIEHHGVKGQRWGVKRRRISGTAKRVAGTTMAVGGLAGMALTKGKSGRSTFKAGVALNRSANRDFKKSDKLEKKYAKRASMSTKQKALSSAGKFAASAALSAALTSVAFHQTPAQTLKMYAGVYSGLGRMGSAAAKMAASKGGAILKEAGYRAANPGFSHLSAAGSAAARAATNGALRLK